MPNSRFLSLYLFFLLAIALFISNANLTRAYSLTSSLAHSISLPPTTREEAQAAFDKLQSLTPGQIPSWLRADIVHDLRKLLDKPQIYAELDALCEKNDDASIEKIFKEEWVIFTKLQLDDIPDKKWRFMVWAVDGIFEEMKQGPPKSDDQETNTTDVKGSDAAGAITTPDSASDISQSSPVSPSDSVSASTPTSSAGGSPAVLPGTNDDKSHKKNGNVCLKQRSTTFGLVMVAAALALL